MKTRMVLRVSGPCSLEWSELDGDGSVRHCGECNTAVYDLDALRSDAIVALVRANPRGFCGRYTSLPGEALHVRSEGSDVPPRRLARGTAVAVLATTLVACTREGVSDQPRHKPSAARAVETVAIASPSPAAQHVSSSPSSPVPPLARETCEQLQSLGYINVDCNTLPHEPERH